MIAMVSSTSQPSPHHAAGLAPRRQSAGVGCNMSTRPARPQRYSLVEIVRMGYGAAPLRGPSANVMVPLTATTPLTRANPLS